jgi:cytochrome c peroxidase
MTVVVRTAHRRASLVLVVSMIAFAMLCSVFGCSDEPEPAPYQWQLPKGFPEPYVPANNPMSEAKVRLGQHLFHDKRLSVNRTMSCAGCHFADRYFADGEMVSTGATGMMLPRNSPSLQNVAYASTYTWANPVLETLEQQVLVPMFGEFPIEMGIHLDLEAILSSIKADNTYQLLFADAFPRDKEPVSKESLVNAIASFVRSIISGGSPYDRYQYEGDNAALSDSAKRGMDMFFSERLECYHCHAGINLTNAFRSKDSTTVAQGFENDGLYNVGGANVYPAGSKGLFEFTSNPRDDGAFRVPSLRNVMVTAPYMHDGSIANIDGVIDMYARGGRLIEGGNNAGDGALNRNKSSFIRGFTLTPTEREDLKAFLVALTDPSIVNEPRFTNPWP